MMIIELNIRVCFMIGKFLTGAYSGYYCNLVENIHLIIKVII